MLTVCSICRSVIRNSCSFNSSTLWLVARWANRKAFSSASAGGSEPLFLGPDCFILLHPASDEGYDLFHVVVRKGEDVRLKSLDVLEDQLLVLFALL